MGFLTITVFFYVPRYPTDHLYFIWQLLAKIGLWFHLKHAENVAQVNTSAEIVWRRTNLMHNLFLVYSVNLYMFRTYRGPSSGVQPYVYNNRYLVFYFWWLFIVLVALEPGKQSSKQNNKYQLLYTYCYTSWWWA